MSVAGGVGIPGPMFRGGGGIPGLMSRGGYLRFHVSGDGYLRSHVWGRVVGIPDPMSGGVPYHVTYPMMYVMYLPPPRGQND